jgi:hypothetical protein
MQEKARLLESNRALSTPQGGIRVYLLERPFDPPFLALPLRLRDLEAPPDRDLLALRADDFRPPAFRAPVFFLPPARGLAFFPADAFRAADFFPPEDFFVDFPAPDLGAVKVGRDVAAGRLALVPPLAARPAAAAPEPNGVRPAAPGAAAPAPKALLGAPLPYGELLLVPLAPAAPPEPPPVRDDSCRFPEPFGRPRLPLGAPPPKRSSSSSSSSESSPSLTTVASESTSSSSSASSALSHRRSL